MITLIANIHQNSFKLQQYQQKDQLLEIQSVMAVKHINHYAGLEQATCDINHSVDPITSSLHDFIQNTQT
ncbi:hypothetical protein FHS76_004560 [Ochrobactrum daejeonense]|uniref:Uncharacterized protein n=1 Tax=Brucella daejeonensis TaxID=659015 RepID=A0A7W9B1S0_9HYPH|nr:hypothetical protein [Brucella daejeonensis]